jgi:PIN domain nuclease of toxin-antitoxin system
MSQDTSVSPKLELTKSALESLTLYAHGLVSLTELSKRLQEEGITITHVTTTFAANCTVISTGPSQPDIYLHLSKLSGETDSRGFPIEDETCIINL